MAKGPGSWRVLRRGWWLKQLGGGRVIGLVALILMLGVRAVDPVALEEVRVRTFDLFQNLKPRETPPEHPVTVVDLDEDSIKEIGQWPWPRTIMAQMVTNLIDAGAIVIGFDIYFAEPDRMSPASVARTLPGLDDETRKRLEGMPSNDLVLAEAMRKGHVVVGQTGIPLEARRDNKIPNIPTIAELGGNPRPYLDSYRSILRNTPEIDFAASGWGVVTFTPETDGVVRRVPAMVTDGKEIYPALSIEMLRLATANESLGIKIEDPRAGIAGVIVRPNLVKTDGHGRIWVYAAHYDPSKYLSAKDVINNHFDTNRVKGKLVLVGTSGRPAGRALHRRGTADPRGRRACPDDRDDSLWRAAQLPARRSGHRMGDRDDRRGPHDLTRAADQRAMDPVAARGRHRQHGRLFVVQVQ